MISLFSGALVSTKNRSISINSALLNVHDPKIVATLKITSRLKSISAGPPMPT